LLFQVISQLYERGSLSSPPTNFKQWSSIFNNDAAIASAVLDRLCTMPKNSHHRRLELQNEDQIET